MRTTHLNNNNDFQCRICERAFQNQQVLSLKKLQIIFMILGSSYAFN